MSTKFYSNKSNAKRAALAAGLQLEACELKTDGKGFAYVPADFQPTDPVTCDTSDNASKPTELASLLAAAGDEGGAATLLQALGIPATPGPTEAPVAAVAPPALAFTGDTDSHL